MEMIERRLAEVRKRNRAKMLEDAEKEKRAAEKKAEMQMQEAKPEPKKAEADSVKVEAEIPVTKSMQVETEMMATIPLTQLQTHADPALPNKIPEATAPDQQHFKQIDSRWMVNNSEVVIGSELMRKRFQKDPRKIRKK